MLKPKRKTYDWFVKGRRTNYDMTSILSIRKQLKLVNHKINTAKQAISDLSSKTQAERTLDELKKEIQELELYISYDNHQGFLKNWQIVGRSNYGISLKAFSNCRQKFNELITQEYETLSIEVRQTILSLHEQVTVQESLVESEQKYNQSLIPPIALSLIDYNIQYFELHEQLQNEIIPLKEYLSTTFVEPE